MARACDMELILQQGVPEGAVAFLENAGWKAARIDPLPGDASFRRYFRISHPVNETDSPVRCFSSARRCFATVTSTSRRPHIRCRGP